MKLRLKRFLPFVKRCLIGCLKIAASVGFGYLIYSLLAPIAYAERGYMSYGGECLLAMVATVFMGKFLFSPSSQKAEKSSYCEIRIVAEPSVRKTSGTKAFDYEKQSGR